ncbi:MAG: histidinol phosphate phosphatase [Proteobacteria bacterium]|nr:histidinol phosphate phosphatase [Pseudomonadota bacterium]MDA1131809.1 histidinol phosphate phosphatase [Pseudomonadota bacterium]
MAALGESPPIEAWIEVAGAAADAAGDVIRGAFRRAGAVETKGDGSPVTAADREAERAMRAVIAAAFPDHGIRGEELPERNVAAETVWVLDPIDGTRSFITGKPVFTTLIGVLHRATPVAGLIDQAITGERWIGARGRATTWNGSTARVRGCPGLARAAMYTTGTEWYGPEERAGFDRLRDRVGMTLFSADAYAFGLLASGQIDLVIECRLAPHDFVALLPVVEGAGGIFTDWQGRRPDPAGPANILAAGDPRVHEAAMAVLAERPA